MPAELAIAEDRDPVMFFYSCVLGASLAVSSPWWVWRMLTTARYRDGLRERLGRVPERIRSTVAGGRVIWFHAVSVGEVLAVSRVIGELEAALAHADSSEMWRVVISTTTRTGQSLARERFGAARVFWFPLDFAWTVRAWMKVLQPRLVVLVESELWPRLLAECRRRAVPVAVVNARMSDRSFRRALRVRRLWGRVLRGVTVFLAQGDETAERLRKLGVAEGAVRVSGNLKYDVIPRETEMVAMLRKLLERRNVVVAGSLLEPEEKFLLEGWPQVRSAVPQAVLLLAPRHPERFEAVGRLGSGDLTIYRASTLLKQQHGQQPLSRLESRAVVLLDTVGDLASVYGLADVAFVGGSLARKGGHNPLEPARFGVPVLMGPSFENFREIVSEMLAQGAMGVVRDGEELARDLRRLLTDRVAADAMGQRGLRVFERRSGATETTVQALLSLSGAGPMAAPLKEVQP